MHRPYQLGARYDASQAEAAAGARVGLDSPQETIHAMTKVFAGAPARSTWLVVYAGGDAASVPWGPAFRQLPPVISYTGVVVDDQTGEVLLSFRGGHQ